MTHIPYGPYEKYMKRPLDLIISLVVLALFWWVLAIVAILVRVNLGSPIIFKQERPGKDEKIFTLYKFRTMTSATDSDGNLLPDKDRLTSFGKFLRSTSLDELPELFNLIKGDMSLIGPRPLLVKYLPRYNTTQHRRHEVTPGLTGLAQAHGRNAIRWEERFELDVEYVDHITFFGDMQIIIDTIRSVLHREGISSTTSVTMEEFKGTELLEPISTDSMNTSQG